MQERDFITAGMLLTWPRQYNMREIKVNASLLPL